MSIRTYLILTILLLSVSIINNVIMYNKCYINNKLNDPFVPENIGMYTINIYYNKNSYPEKGIYEALHPYIDEFKNNNISKYVVTYNKPTSDQYKQMTQLTQ